MNSSPRGKPLPLTPRRLSQSGSLQRPSTSGDMVESAYLRDALMEKRGMHQRARSTTPRRLGASQRSQTQKDEWLQSSGDESKSKLKVPSRPPRQRRASDISSLRPTLPSTKTLGAKDAESRLDRIEKENWDLKHRLTLFEERTKRLNSKIEEQGKEIEDLKEVEERCEQLEQDLKLTQEQLDLAQDEVVELHNDNVELTQINEELVKQLEQRVKELEDMERDAESRQAAIEEAAGIIQMLENRVADGEQVQLHLVPDSPPRTDSDYYSGEPDPTRLAPIAAKPPTTANSAPDSDYFSADTSPIITPRSVKQVDVPVQNAPCLNAASMSSAAFNREVGLRSITSKESLLSVYLETPRLPEPTNNTSRLARLRSIRKRATSPKRNDENITPEIQKSKKLGKGWLTGRPLRNFYMNLDSSKSTPDSKDREKAIPQTQPHQRPYSSDEKFGAAKSSSTPSIAQASMPVATPEKATPSANKIKHVRSNSTNSRQELMRHNSTPSTGVHSSSRSQRRSNAIADVYIPAAGPRQQLVASSRSTKSVSPDPSRYDRRAAPVVYTPSPTQSDAIFSSTKPTTQTHSNPVVPSPNYAVWPRKYPAWPPSAGLASRGLLFHGEGMDEMFGRGDDEDEFNR